MLKGDVVRDAIYRDGPELTGYAGTGREPSLYELIVRYYGAHFSEADARSLANTYVNDLCSELHKEQLERGE